MGTSDRYWFSKKKMGWGWGVPATWEGWAALALYAACMVGADIIFRRQGHNIEFLISIAALTALLLIILVRKGEPAKWSKP